ncbi:uncharacterized protein PF11_0213-like [Apis florea]|uniref:uncharacterized protein PF11_0213-like n=1 Tax=Apis florea TaxID=7463 RepID=UPI0012FF04F1|nr:uncharacterized protein PF11_0213-like [Apis florea]
MDSLHPPPLKKYRRVTNINIPVLECKREFNLPHKFPSMINSSKCNFIPKDCKQITNTEVHNNLNGLNTKKTLATSGIKKLRVKTRDGKDLGEVKVQFLPQKNILNTQKIIYNQQIKSYKKNNAVNFSVASKDNINGLKSLGSRSYDRDLQKFPTEAQHCAVEPQFIVKTITPRELSIAINKKSAEIQNKNKSISKKHYILAKVNEISENDKLLLLSENGHESLHTAPKTMQLINNNITSINKEKDEVLLKKEECIFKNNKKNVINGNNNIIIEPEILRKTNISNLKNSMTQLAESKFPLVKCEKLSVSSNVVSKTKVNVNRISLKATNKKQCSNLNIDNYSKVFSSEKIFKSNNNLCNSRINENKKYKTIIKKATNIVPKNFNNKINDCNEDDVVIICEKNATSNNIKQYSNNTQEESYIPVNNKNIDKKTQSIFNEVNNKLDLCENRTICNNDNILNNESKFDETNVEKINYNMKKEKLLDCLNIIKEALISVKDEELQIKALNALAECGIGIAKQIPITPLEKLKTVHDSQIQTDVFGLLDMKSFILVKEDMPVLERIKQIEHSTVDFLPIIKEVQTQTKIQIQPKTKQNNNMNVNPTWSSISLEDTLNLEDYFNKYFNDNNDVNRVKKVLSTPHYLYKKVSVQIEKDYEEMQHWDNNGMLNIHRAVLNNQLYELQRLLLILKASKTNIDALTEDGMTSLELAIKSNASNDIVDLLLKAGAKPLSLELLHESAIIIASKQSSPFLLQLLNYVIDPKLLNRVDSLGMAPLHYCSLNGYIDGVNALIKSGAEVNLKDNRSGRTPFFHALENNHVSVAQKLLECGAIADLPNFSGQSVLTLLDETKSFLFRISK